MNSSALLHFMEAILWCVLVFYAIAGYGALLLRLFGIRAPYLGFAALTGFGPLIFIAGLLNLAHAITAPVLITIVLLGVIAAWTLRVNLASPAETIPFSRVATILFLIAAAFLAVRFIESYHTLYYQASDDYNFYLATPLKMLQLHHFASDPFSERRIMSSLGGNYFLQTIILSVLPLADVQMADRGLGILLLALVALGLAHRLALTATQRALFMVLVIFMPQLQFNLTFVILPCALFFGMVYLAADSEIDPTLQALLLGMTAAVAASTKSTYLPHGVLFIMIFALFRWGRHGFAVAFQTFGVAAVATLAVLIPWMYASHLTSGTWFYPSLGPGFHYSAYHLFPAPSAAGTSVILHKVIPFCVPLAFILVVEWFLGDQEPSGEAILTLTAASLVATLLVGIATGGDSVRRYNYPTILPAIVLLTAVFSRRQNRQPGSRSASVLQAASVVFIVITAISIWFNRLSFEIWQVPNAFRAAIHDTPIVPQSKQDQYDAVQNSIPEGAKVLATANEPFLLDFRARDIKIADYPGAAGLAPGWPSTSDGEALARYLTGHGIRYLIYSKGDFVGFDQSAPQVVHDTVHTEWIHSETRIAYLSHQQYAQLFCTRNHLYNDGEMYVLDLATSATNCPIPPIVTP
jgi:hypothetical protein